MKRKRRRREVRLGGKIKHVISLHCTAPHRSILLNTTLHYNIALTTKRVKKEFWEMKL